ncbi:hypothetical protein [uncultured Bacteroides sp.]|uniref:hypothetical protein n=1 Tax=uncultured Bacteroides sp. TaxID=162156 RepID=UPI0027DDF4F3|nr:hypothetical protein [uncultured Bacteroides sp.]
MDEFDAVDIVYNAVAAMGTNILIYKDKSEAGVTNEHIVINHLQLNELDFINKVPVNINIFVPLNDNGMNRRQRMKELKRKVRKSLNSINSNDGVCKEVTVLWSVPMPDLKEGFACTNIRLEILIDQ